MATNTTDATIRTVSLLRRGGSIFVVSTILIILVSNVYHRLSERWRIADLKIIRETGVSTLASVEEEYEIKTINYKPQLTFNYSFTENGETYTDEYILYEYLPKESEALKKIFTVHYLKSDPDKHSLNIDYEIQRTERNIEESSTLWLVVKVVFACVLGLVLITQIVSLISEIRNLDKPIEVPEYLKK